MRHESMKRNVYVVGAYQDYIRMFVNEGYENVDSVEDADLVVFCGGEDVSPNLYNQHTHATTYSNKNRDDKEAALYAQAKELGIPCVGICRGGQFLHVMNGASLYQDVDNHTGEHEALILGDLVPVRVSSTHHQMMAVSYNGNDDCIVLMKAYQSSRKACMSNLNCPSVERIYHIDKGEDVEAVYWMNTNDLCFQPHPEFEGYVDCRKVFFSFIETYLFEEN